MGASREVCLSWEGPPCVCEASSPHGLGTQGLDPQTKPKVISSFRCFLFGILSGNSNNNQNKINKQH